MVQTDPMDFKALGDHEAFSAWSGKPRQWGPDGTWRAWFGGKVVDGLCELLDERLDLPQNTAVIGCVPWFRNDAVIERLLKMSACCIVVDKQEAAQQGLISLAGEGEICGFPTSAMSRLNGLAPSVDGEPRLLHPSMSMEDAEPVLDPVRVLGYQAGNRPRLHAKMLVIGHIEYSEPIDEFVESYSPKFIPRTVWFGSANWTNMSARHLETGFACDDPDLVREATDFLADLIASSEPIDSPCVGPEGDLLPMGEDTAAFQEADYESRLAYEEYREEQLEAGNPDPDDYEP